MITIFVAMYIHSYICWSFLVSHLGCDLITTVNIANGLGWSTYAYALASPEEARAIGHHGIAIASPLQLL